VTGVVFACEVVAGGPVFFDQLCGVGLVREDNDPAAREGELVQQLSEGSAAFALDLGAVFELFLGWSVSQPVGSETWMGHESEVIGPV
jgi:hypothetical protein